MRKLPNRFVQLVDESGNLYNAGNPLPTTGGGGGGGGVSMVDETSFAEGVSSFEPTGGVVDDSLIAVGQGLGAAVRLTPLRAYHVNLRNVSGVEIGTAGNPVRIDPTGTTTQPVSIASSLPAGGNTIGNVGVTSLPSIPSGANTIGNVGVISLPVTTVAGVTAKTLDYDTGVGTDTVPAFGVLLPASGGAVAGGTSTNPIRIDPVGTTAQPITDNGGSLTVDAPAATPVAIAITDTSNTLVKPGDASNNAIRVNIVAGGATGGTSQQDKSAFVEGTDLFNPIGGVYNETISADPTEDQAAAVRITAKRGLHVNLRTAAGAEIGTAGSPVRIDPTGTTTQPVSGTVTANQGGSWTVAATQSGLWTVDIGSALPSGNNNVGDVDVASLPAATNAGATAKVLDYDTGAGTDNITAFGILLPKSGGAVAGGTSSDPIRIDPTGTTTQPVSGTVAVSSVGGTVTVTGTVAATQSGAWNVGLNAGSNTVGKVDQGAAGVSAWPVKTEVQIDYDTGAGTQNLSVMGLALPASGGAVAGGTSTNPIRVDPTGTTSQPVTDGGGSLTVDAPAASPVPIAITDTSNTLVKAGDSSNNAIRVNIVAGAGSGGTALADQSTFTEGSTSFTPVGGEFNDTPSDPSAGQAAAARITAKRAVHVNLRNNSGTEIGTSGAPIRIDPTGTTTQPVSGTVAVSSVGGTVTISGTVTIGSALPAGNNNIGDVDVASLPVATNAGATAKTFDYDTGAGTDTVTAFGIALPASGGAVAGGTSTNPVRIDPTGTTTQPVSGTVTANQGGAWTVTIGAALPAGNNNIGDVDVVSLPATTNAGATAKTLDYDTGVGTDTVTAFGILLPKSGGSVAGGTSSDPIRIDPTGTTTQPVSGTVTANQGGAWNVGLNTGSNTIGKVDQGAAGASAWPVKTEVQIDYDTGAGTQNLSIVGMALPASGGAVAGGTSTNPIRIDPTGTTTQPVSGTVTSNQGTAAAGSGAWPVTVTDTSNTVVKPGDAVNNAVRVNIVAGSSSGVSQVDRTTFTDGTSTFAPIGGYFNDSATNPTSGQAATARITAKRAVHTNLRDNSGNEIGIAAAPIRIDPTGTTTQPVQGGKTNNNAAPGATNVGTLPAIANAAAPTWTEGNQVALSTDLSGNQRTLLSATAGTVSTANSSTATLTANSVFTGTSENITGYASIDVAVFADQNSAVLGLSFQFSEDGTNWDFTETYTITANTPAPFVLRPCCKFFRIVYTNGGTGQGAFRLQTIFRQTAIQLGGTTKEPMRVDPVGTTTQPVSLSTLPATENYLGFVGGAIAGISANFTRPNDTIAYATGDAVTDSTSAPTKITFTNCARLANGTGRITGVHMVDSANQTTKGVFELWIFDSSVTPDNDNTVFTPTDTECGTLVAIVPLNVVYVGDATAGAGGNAVYYSGEIDRPFTCTGATRDLYGLMVVRGAYTPVAQEVFTFRLRIDQD